MSVWITERPDPFRRGILHYSHGGLLRGHERLSYSYSVSGPTIYMAWATRNEFATHYRTADPHQPGTWITPQIVPASPVGPAHRYLESDGSIVALEVMLRIPNGYRHGTLTIYTLEER